MTGLLVNAGANEGSGQTPEFGTFSWSLGMRSPILYPELIMSE